MPGTVLLLAASPQGRGCLVDAASVLPVLAAVSPAVLSGTDTANVVELADPLEPQAVLTRLRAAATSPDPLTVFVTGQLQTDRKQRLPHLALARTTPSTVRYTGFPWHWFREELRLRAPGSTTLFADLHADAETWELLRTQPLDSGAGTAVYGRVAPPPQRRTVAQPAYMKAVATLLRSGHRPPAGQLHEAALARLLDAETAATGGRRGGRGQGREQDLVLSEEGRAQDPVPGERGRAQDLVPGERGQAPAPPLAPAPASVPGEPAPEPAAGDPHAEITAAAQAGRHAEADALAARWAEAAVREHGPASEEVLHWAEVRADLAMLAGDPARSCRTWLEVASARLAAGQAADAPAVETAADRAHHQWSRIQDSAQVRELGLLLAELRERVPGRREGALENVRRHLDLLQAANP
ncbi:hypothetical protein [Streptomyces sp. NPDC047000]|uniref:hypothetical protein n=1 Tax=Streptomyces sp. NPDC047000 TaxID=3155474 RepID=UPI0034112603